MTKFDDRKFHRRSIRLKGYDYSQPGAYFVTLVTEGRACLFGEVEAGKVCLNPFGSIVRNEWQRLEDRFSRVVVDQWIIMPNHLHGILVIVEGVSNREVTNGADGGARQESSRQIVVPSFATPIQRYSSDKAGGSLGAIVGAFKSTTTRLINALRRCPGERIWQRDYFEHIIRNKEEWDAIRIYIHDNPGRWEFDRENPSRAQIRE